VHPKTLRDGPICLKPFALTKPYAYLKDVLERMTHGHPANRIDDLLPWNWIASNVET